MLTNYDIVADVGDQTGTMKAFDITVPATAQVTIDLSHEVENPLINGIEIIRHRTSRRRRQRAGHARQSRRSTARTAGPASTPSTRRAIAWSQVRGAFMVGNTLFYGYTDGNFYKRTFDGTTFGTPTLVDPYNDPIWSNVADRLRPDLPRRQSRRCTAPRCRT